MTAPQVPSSSENDSDQRDDILDSEGLPLSSPEKRKATAPPLDSPQRPCTRQRLSPRASEPKPLWSAPPEPGSINATIREHCRSRLYVRPIAWTMSQPRLLGCQFVLCDLPLEPIIGQGTTRLQNHKVQQKLIRIAKVLQRPSDDPSSEKAAIKSLVRAYNVSSDLKTYLPSVPFSFGDRVVAHVQLDGVYSVDPKKAIFAFFHLESLNMGREGSLSKKTHKRESEPVARLRDKKLRARQPVNAFEDPYIVAALIALAQAQRWFQTESDKAAQPAGSGEAQPSSNASALFTTRLLLVTEIQSQHLYMYEASFSSAFLDQLKNPSQFSPADPVQISYYRLPLGNADELVEHFPDVLGLNHE